MADNFAASLAARIQSHNEFWNDLARLQVAGACSTVSQCVPLNENSLAGPASRSERLLYSASIFAQTNTEEHRAIAQTIALNTLLVDSSRNMQERAKSILANLGNFPAIQFIERGDSEGGSTFFSVLQAKLLRAVNSVIIGDAECALTDFQLDVWGSLDGARIVSVSAPTSAGKSFIVIEHLLRKVHSLANAVVVYVVPTRALLAEVHRKISERLADSTNIRVSTVPALDAEQRPKQIFVLTQERLQVLLAISELKVDVLIVDEAQNLSDGARGMILQDCLERICRINPDIQVLLLAPGAEGFQDIAAVIGAPTIEERETGLSPVLQNRIVVKAVEGDAKRLSLSLLTRDGTVEVGYVVTARGVTDPATRLAVAALELGGQGGALVYARGPADAEALASQLAADVPVSPSPALEELAAFIREHIHARYGLGSLVRHAVAFHYGRMPQLLRVALETAFRSLDIKYLVCTTTLFQGVNLPARSVFINTSSRGKGEALDPAQLWNFAGRAGRLGQDLVGNVFLVDYDNWKEKPFDKRAKFRVRSAFSETLRNHFDPVMEAVNGAMPKQRQRDLVSVEVRAAAGLLLARAAKGMGAHITQQLPDLSDEQRQSIASAATEAVAALGLPTSVLENNWTVDPFGLERLARRMREKIDGGDIDDLIPVHPGEQEAYSRYASIFSRIDREVFQNKPSRYGRFVALYALPWMRGVPYPVILDKWIRYHESQYPQRPINRIVREAFEFIEDILRFRMVQLGKAYIDVLHHLLETTGHGARRREVFDYALALELGISSTSGRAFIELGLSRISAVALGGLFPDSEMTPSHARARLRELDVDAVDLSPVIVRELRDLGLLGALAV